MRSENFARKKEKRQQMKSKKDKRIEKEIRQIKKKEYCFAEA